MENITLPLGGYSNVFLSSDPATYTQQVSRLARKHLHRRERNALYRSKLPGQPVRDDAFEENVNFFGLLRAYNAGIRLGDYRIDPSDIALSASTKAYTFDTKIDIDVDGEKQPVSVSAYFSFQADTPGGHLEVNGRIFRATLDPKPLTFKSKLSHNAGARWNSGESRLVWDTESKDWDNAIWEETLDFAYCTATVDDPWEPVKVIENYFTDKSTNPPTEFNLTKDQRGIYSCTVKNNDETKKAHLETFNKSEMEPPVTRKNSNTRSAFPHVLLIEFDPWGMHFDGAYKYREGVEEHVYAISGDIDIEDTSLSVISALASRQHALPAHSVFDFLSDANGPDDFIGRPPLAIQGLLNNDPMEWDPKEKQYHDVVAKEAMNDFFDIVKYYLDEDLRKTFVSATPVKLHPKLKAIADDDPNNHVFYKKLQVPYLTAVLAQSTLPDGEKCNGKRANKLLSDLPVDDPVYKRHSTKLYRMHYLEMFPNTREYLSDQYNTSHAEDVKAMAATLKTNIAKSSEDAATHNPDYEKDLARAQADIDSLADWAQSKRLWWAFRLLYWVEKVSLPLWYAQYNGGGLSASIGREIKKLNSIFGVLEDDQVNKEEGGRSFMQAYNEAIRLFQMTSIIPTLVDIDGNSSEFDTLVKACLREFWERNKNSPNSKMVEQAAFAIELYRNNDLRNKMIAGYKRAQILAGGLNNWGVMVRRWEDIVGNSKWFLKLGSKGQKLLRTVQITAAVVILGLPLFPGGTLTSVIGTITGRILQGTVRLIYFFEHISGFWDTAKCILGFEGVIDKLPSAATQISNSFARFFTRTAKQTLSMVEEELALPFGGIKQFSRFSRLFGRNMSEVLANVAGIVLAITGLIWSAIELAKGGTPLQIASNTMMVLSSAIQILGLAAGWLATAGFAPGMLAPVLSFVGSIAGPLAVVFALIGIILMIVSLFKEKPKTPVEEFVDNRVKKINLFMKFGTDIDYFDVINSDTGEPSLAGLSIQGSATGIFKPASPEEQVFLRLSGEEKPPAGVDYVKNLDFTTDTVWSLRTDGYGRSQIFTQKYFVDAEGDTYRTVWYLGSAEGDASEVTAIQLPQRGDDEDKYKKAVERTYWNIDLTTGPVKEAKDGKDGKSKKPIASLCSFKQGERLLAIECDTMKQVPKRLVITSKSEIESPMSRFVSLWMIQMRPLKPAQFSYTKTPWQLTTESTDEATHIMWDIIEATSSGYKWTITPPLNENVFELITEPGMDEGSIRMKKGVHAPVMPKTRYTVTCSAKLPSGPVEVSSHLEIVVLDAKAPVEDEDENVN
ncbi:hypothetical protein PT974_07241 [Cladobotryum mycophilum]|uniref:Ig-like domain-containing protein n=1 Tax=Cladobotryum mycophilum TaxID=491253 RepID=A0ABR0SNR1_9HYPO